MAAVIPAARTGGAGSHNSVLDWLLTYPPPGLVPQVLAAGRGQKPAENRVVAAGPTSPGGGYESSHFSTELWPPREFRPGNGRAKAARLPMLVKVDGCFWPSTLKLVSMGGPWGLYA